MPSVMSAVPAGRLISSMLEASNCRSTLERREKSGIFRRSSTLAVTDRSFVWSASYHELRCWYAVGVVLRSRVRVPLGPPGGDELSPPYDGEPSRASTG